MAYITDADRLVAAGAELTIAGHLFHVRYTPRSLKMMEDRYGSIQAAGEQLVEASQGKGKMFGLVFYMLSLGLMQEAIDGVRIDEEWLLDNADIKDLRLYGEIAFDALSEALPGVPEGVDPTKPEEPAIQNGSTSHHGSGSL